MIVPVIPYEADDSRRPSTSGTSSMSNTIANSTPSATRPSSIDLEKAIVEKHDHKAHVPEATKDQIPPDVVWVTWDGPDDPKNPYNWSRGRKWMLTTIGLGFCSIVSLSMGGYTISAPSMQRELNASPVLFTTGIALFLVTYASAPLLLAPLSEVYGRSPVYIVSALLFTISLIPHALAKNIATLLIFRFICGIAASVAVAIVAGTLADIWSTAERGLPLAAFSYCAFAATGLGPAMFGVVEQYRGFRIINWIVFAMSSVFTLSVIIFLRETRTSVLLAKKAARMRKETGDNRYQSKEEFLRASFAALMKTSLVRPLRMLVTEPTVIAFTLWGSFCWGALFLLLVSIAPVFRNVYGFSTAAGGLVFVTQIIGATIGLAYDHYGNKVYHKHAARIGPEARLYEGMVGGVVMPIGFWIYAWSARESIHWIVPCIGITLLYAGMYLIYLTFFCYLSDAYTLYASSALAAQSFVRSMTGVGAVYCTVMYDKLGVAGGGSILAGFATILAIIPFIFFMYGAKIRARSRFAVELASIQQEK